MALVVVIAYIAAFFLLLTPLGRHVGIWQGSKDADASFWRRHYGAPGLGLYVLGAAIFLLAGVSAYANGRTWLAALCVPLVVLQVVGIALEIRKRRRTSRAS